MSIFPSLSFGWPHAALTTSLKHPVQRNEIMHISVSVWWIAERWCQVYFLDVWRDFKQQALFCAESSVQAKYRHLGNLCIQNPSHIWNIKHIKFSVSNKTIKCPWVSSQTLEKILLFPSNTFTLRNRVSEKFRIWEI